ncbi:flagellar motor switch protein FliN [Symbiobacterium thermophilum]|uniref:Flagellar motor switch protein FliN n=1 Tax=Symbiobacterium thermophilum TaxID=2734 RepID=A0A953IBS8_SYMTR|nr:flagellar motor switch protein FliN [Symbiobacterium thermophilum]MBY6276459.1 flagellar motor switch protein FliN [Symbiobacterium thermophilum]
MANKLSQSEIDALVASLLAADNAEKQAADGQSGQGSPETAAPAAGQNAEGAPSEFESVQDLGPVTQAELDAAVAASRAAKMKGTAPAAPETAPPLGAPAAPFEAAAAAAAAVPAPAPAAPAGPGPGASKAQLRIPPALRGVLLDIELTLSVELGKARLPLGEILSMGPGSVITLDRLASEPLNVKVNGLPAMTAEVIAIGEKYGIRIVESQLPNYAAAS